MNIKAKFSVVSVGESLDSQNNKYAELLTLRPVYSTDPNSENYSFSQFTPNGLLELTITNQAIWGQFAPGQEFYLDLSPVYAAPLDVPFLEEVSEFKSASVAPEQEFLLQFFSWEHLPAHLQEVSQPFGELAHQIVNDLPRNPERTVALRKLLEAKDCAVRAKLAK